MVFSTAFGTAVFGFLIDNEFTIENIAFLGGAYIVISLIILVISSLVLSIPSAPGMIGTFHASVKYIMVDIFAFTPNDGNSFAILMHAYGYILFTFLGAYYFLKSQFHVNAIENVLNTDSNELQKN